MNLEQHKQMNIDALERLISKLKQAKTTERIIHCLDVGIKGAKAGKELILNEYKNNNRKYE